MEEAAGVHDDGERHETYNIGDNEDDECDAMSQWSESHELPGHGVAGDAADQGGQATGMGGAADGIADTSKQSAGGAWNNWSHAQWHAPHWQTDQHGRWRRASWADQWEAEYAPPAAWAAGQGSGAAQHARREGSGRDDDEPCEPSAKHRRQHDSQRGMQVEGPHVSTACEDAAATNRAQAADASVGTPSASQDGAANFARQVANVIDRAISMGIQPIADNGDELITLSPELLARWVAEHLEAGDGQ